ncbi:hypothetical protein [Allorhizobium undicola]|uniref:hypothetical protein n=1 Tax=Allorhizobium undicola TaxID=78527 RepID=UPI00048013EA|nr:hypothetical protein [Allorhizobium undicola]
MTTNETVINQIAGNLQKIIDQQLDRDYQRPKYWVTWMIDRTLFPVPYIILESTEHDAPEHYAVFVLLNEGQPLRRRTLDDDGLCRTVAHISVDKRQVKVSSTDDGWVWDDQYAVSSFAVEFGNWVFEVEMDDLYEGVEFPADKVAA